MLLLTALLFSVIPAQAQAQDVIVYSPFNDEFMQALAGLEPDLPRPRERDLSPGDRVTLVIRPEHLFLDPDIHARRLECTLVDVHYLGAMAAYFVELPDCGQLIVHQPAPVGSALRKPGEKLALGLNPDRVSFIAEQDCVRGPHPVCP